MIRVSLKYEKNNGYFTRIRLYIHMSLNSSSNGKYFKCKWCKKSKQKFCTQ